MSSFPSEHPKDEKGQTQRTSDTEMQPLPEAGTKTNSFGLEQRSDHSTMKAGSLGCDSILEMERRLIDDKREGVLNDFVLGSRHGNPDRSARRSVPQEGLHNPYGRVGVDKVHPEDWDIVLDTLLDDISTDLT